MYWPLCKVYMTFKRVGCSITGQRVQIGTWFVPTYKRRARVYVPCGRTMVSSEQAHVIRTRLQIRYGFLCGTTFSRSTSLRLFIVNLYCLKAGDFYVSQIVTNTSSPCTSSCKIFSVPKGRKTGRYSLSRSELLQIFNFRVTIRIRNYITSQDVSQCIMDLVRRTVFIRETVKNVCKIVKILSINSVCVCVCVCGLEKSQA